MSARWLVVGALVEVGFAFVIAAAILSGFRRPPEPGEPEACPTMQVLDEVLLKSDAEIQALQGMTPDERTRRVAELLEGR